MMVMFKTKIYFIFVIASVICGSSGDVDLYPRGGRIVGGVEVNIQAHPYMAALQSSDVHFCGATILTPSWLLTAAHCGMDRPWNKWILKDVALLSVVVGSADILFTDSGSQTRRVKLFILHPRFDVDIAYNDIALIKVTEPIVFSKSRVAPVRLTTTSNKEYDPKPGSKCVALGWGTTEPQSKGRDASSPLLLMVKLQLVPIRECIKNHSMAPVIQGTNLCTSTVGAKDTCAGDSGGPLMCNGEQWGVTSWGHGCAQKDTPGVWTRVDRYLDWIREVTTGTGHLSNKRSSSESVGLKHNSYMAGVHFLSVFFAYICYLEWFMEIK